MTAEPAMGRALLYEQFLGPQWVGHCATSDHWALHGQGRWALLYEQLTRSMGWVYGGACGGEAALTSNDIISVPALLGLTIIDKRRLVKISDVGASSTECLQNC